LKSVLSTTISKANKPQEKNEDVKSEDWKSSGPFILLLLLPLAALAFRRGWLFNVIVVASLVGLLQPQPVLASPLTESISEGWNNLWINNEQQAETALKKQQYDKANKLSNNPLMRGTASYKKEDYTKALEEFKHVDGANARYNEGNALAKLEKYKEAINAYDEALKLQPDMEDAKKNKATIEKLLKKKQEQEQKKKKDSNKNDKKNDGKKEQKNTDSKKGENNDKQDNKKDKKDQDGKKGQDSKDKNGSDDKNKKNEKDKADKKNGKQSKNQFADANKDLDKPKPKDSEGTKDSKKNKDEQNKKDSTHKKPVDKAKKAKEEDNKKGEKPVNPDNKKQLKKENTNNKKEQKGTKIEAEELSKEEKMAAEQWLRRIPDDPGGLLRRKFKYQYQQRRRSINDTKQPW
jgi:Ca-activated chloride channel family protein